MRKGVWETIVLMARGFFLVFKSSPFLTPLIFILGLVLALEPAVDLWITKLLIDKLAKIATAGTLTGGFFGLGILTRFTEFGWIMVLIGIQFGVWNLSRLLHSLSSLCTTKARNNFENFVSLAIMKKCAELDLAFFEDSRNLDQLEKALRGSSMHAWNLIWMFFSIVKSMLTLGTYLFLLFMLHWLAPVIVAVTTAPQMLASAYFSSKRYKVYTESTADTRLRYYLAWIIGNKDCAKEVKLFGLADYLMERYRHYSKIFSDVEFRVEKKSEFVNFWLGAFSNLGTIAIWAYTLLRASLSLISPGDALLYLSATESSRHNLLNLFSSGGRLYEHVLFLGDLFALLDRKRDTIEGALTGPEGPGGPPCGDILAPTTLQHGIELKNVSFSYPGKEEFSLKNVSMFLPAGTSVAIVGKNGAGKTTLVKLLTRLYDVTAGEILIDGRNIKEYDLNNLRQMFSVVFQDFVQYHVTLRENIGFGDIDQVNDMAQVQWAAKQAGADEIADKLSMGYETHMMRAYGLEGSVDLSGGEWQKVALARAFMREPAVIILDEPTAALDAFAEAELYTKFDELTKGKLSVVISHRFSTVKIASMIMVLDEGKLVESGSHSELMEKAGLYSEMYNKQADRYK